MCSDPKIIPFPSMKWSRLSLKLILRVSARAFRRRADDLASLRVACDAVEVLPALVKLFVRAN